MVLQRFSLSCRDIQKRFPSWALEVSGDVDTVLAHVRSPEHADAETILFCATPNAIRDGVASRAGAIVIPPSAKDATAGFKGGIVICTKPEAFLPEFLSELVLNTPYRPARETNEPLIHPSASIHRTATVAADAIVGPGAVIGAHVRVEARASIGPNTVIEAGSKIGADTTIQPLVYIGHSTEIGERCEIYSGCVIGKEGYGYYTNERGQHRKVPHIGRVVIEDDVHLGGNCVIDRGTLHETRIAKGVKFDNLVHIAHNCSIGAGSMITAHFAMAGSSEVGKFFVAGGRSVVTGHVKVGDGVRIAALSAVSKDLNVPGDYGGVPLVPLQQHIKIKAAMIQLPEMRKQLARLMKRVFEGEDSKAP